MSDFVVFYRLAAEFEVVKSSEPLYEEMIGEESVKDRLAR